MPADRPNVLLIYTDDQGYGDTDVEALDPDSRIRTPAMDRLASEGRTFTDAHCPDTVCTPSRYGLLTGRYCWRTELKSGVLGAEGPCLIDEDRTTLPSLLGRNGYDTAMVGKWHLGMDFDGEKGERDWDAPVREGPTERGFDDAYALPASMNFGILTWIENGCVTEPATQWTAKKPNEFAIDDFRICPPYEENAALDQYEYVADTALEVAPSFADDEALTTITDRAIDWLDGGWGGRVDSADSNDPFFLYLPYTSPHKPVCPREDFQDESAAGWYGDFVRETDHHVGRLLDALDERGLAEDTLVIFTSDNGPETTYRARRERYGHDSAGGLKGGKRDLYEGGHRVPMFVRWPGVTNPGSVCDAPVCQTDLLATLADVLADPLADDAGEDSASILPAITGAAEDFDRGPIVHHSSSGYFAIREGRWKCSTIRGSGGSLDPERDEPGPDEPAHELYDLATDRAETTNLAAERPDVVDSLIETMTECVERGRTTPGVPQANDGPDWWPQLTWMDEPA
jgi:arylsulfatase A